MLTIHSKFKDYNVHIEDDFQFVKSLTKIENVQYVVDANLICLYKDLFDIIPADRLIVIEAVEENKIIDTALDICEKITQIAAKRNTTLISFGGGIIQDITGFVANIIYRGIKWIFVPTTLLAACDSCIGGKTSLNYKKYKNLLGTFYPPDEIYICPVFFNTLTKRDYLSGLGEVVKFNIMQGKSGLVGIEEDIDRLLNREATVINKYIHTSLLFKKKYIEIDEFDRGERIKLNFAHTFGHAIEVVSNYKIPHGTAVAIGMIMADYISVKRGLLKPEENERMEVVLKRVIDIDVTLIVAPIEQYLSAMRKDKKQLGDSLTAVLIRSYDNEGELEIVHDITETEVEAAIQYFIMMHQN